MMKVKDIMTKDVFTMNAAQNLAELRVLMKARHIRHVPIVDGENHFMGLLTHRDLLSHTISRLAGIDDSEQYDLDKNIIIQHVMKSDVVTASPETDLRTAISILLENKYGCIPVVVEKNLVGIVTEADFLKLTIQLLDADNA